MCLGQNRQEIGQSGLLAAYKVRRMTRPNRTRMTELKQVGGEFNGKALGHPCKLSLTRPCITCPYRHIKGV